MARHATAGVADIGVGRRGSAVLELAAMDADDRGVAGAGRLLAVPAGALRHEQRRARQTIPDCAAQAAAFEGLSLAAAGHQTCRSTWSFLISAIARAGL